MPIFTGRLRRVGNSLSVLVPKQAIDELGVREGDEVEIQVMLLPDERQRRFEAVIGKYPGLGPFKRERKDRY